MPFFFFFNYQFTFFLHAPVAKKKEEINKKRVEEWDRVYLTSYTEENVRLNRNSIGYSEFIVTELLLNNNFLMYILVKLMSQSFQGEICFTL